MGFLFYQGSSTGGSRGGAGLAHPCNSETSLLSNSPGGFDSSRSLGPLSDVVGFAAVPFSVSGLLSRFFRNKYNAAMAVPQITARPPTTPPTIAPTLLFG